MSTIVTRAGKGSALTHNEVDANFTNLNTDKLQSGNTAASLTITSATINGGAINSTTVGATTASTGAFTTLSASSTSTLNGTTIPASSTLLVSGGALGTPSSGTVTNLTGTASININGTVGATTANTGAFTTLSATGVTTVQAGTVSAPAITTSGDTNTGIYFPAADTIAFTEGGAEAMRISSSGHLLVGTTTSYGRLTVSASSGSAAGVEHSGSGTVTAIAFRQGSPSAQVGTITMSGGSSTAYNTSSDYRLKESVQPMTGALAKVAALKPCTYTWKSTGEVGEGFIAHELAEVCPSAVTGEKDAVNEDGSMKPQGIDTSFLVATIVAAMKEQQQMIETLQAKVAALEGA